MRGCRIAEVSRIGVRDTLDEAVLGLDPFGLLDPELRRLVSEQREQRIVLWERVRQLDDAVDEERPQAATSARLWLERVGMRNRAVVLDGELAEPRHDAMGRGGAEALASKREISSPRRCCCASKASRDANRDRS